MTLVALFDTHSVFFRAFHALPPMNTAGGAPTSALYGFSALVLKVVREHAPDELAFAIDLRGKTFRHHLYAAYKGQRMPTPTPLLDQLRRLPEFLRHLAPVLGVPGFEADDVLATMARKVSAQGKEALVVTGDRDLLQVARTNVKILFVGARASKEIVYDAALVEAGRGVSPSAFPMFIALAGDKSDNIVGIAGVGDRTARRLASQFGTVRNLFDNLALVQPDKLRSTLTLHRDRLLLNENLASLRDDIDLGGEPWTGRVDSQSLSMLRAQFEILEFKSLLPRVDALIQRLELPSASPSLS